MRTEGLYEPTLSTGTIRETRSYNIGSLVYVAFFGGVLALTVLATKNAKQLQVRPAIVQALIAASIVIFIAKMGVYYAYFHHLIELDRSSVKFLARGADLLLFGGYFLAMRQPFKQHLVFGGETESLKKTGMIWCLVSVLFEVVCLAVIVNI
jgi:hypothetical protein